MNKRFGFTLAEVLITLAIIGIVAAIILPSFVSNYQKKVRTEQDRTIKYKLTKATDQMKSLGLIGNYSSTDAFIAVLKKHFKIAQVCKNNNLENCWPTKTIETADGTMVNVKDLTTGEDFNPTGYTKNNLGIITADGTAMIISYKDDCESLEPEKTYEWQTDDNKPVTNATTNCIAMIYDINGKGRPNKAGEDVKLFNVAHLGSNKFECQEYAKAGLCMSPSTFPSTPMMLSDPDYDKTIAELGSVPCTTAKCANEGDYWAGAAKVCKDAGGRLPTLSELGRLASAMYGANIGTFTQYSGNQKENPLNIERNFLWSSDGYDETFAYNRAFLENGTHYNNNYEQRSSARIAIRCVRK